MLKPFQITVAHTSMSCQIVGSNQIIKKHLGTNILTNLNGDVMINGVFSVSVHYDGKYYMLRFTNFTL